VNYGTEYRYILLTRRSTVSLNTNTLSVDTIHANPAVDSSTIVPNLESVALFGFDEVKILAALDLAQDNVSHIEIIRTGRRHHCA
jgi:hypothetical protein